jgi:hypothetical protein
MRSPFSSSSRVLRPNNFTYFSSNVCLHACKQVRNWTRHLHPPLQIFFLFFDFNGVDFFPVGQSSAANSLFTLFLFQDLPTRHPLQRQPRTPMIERELPPPRYRRRHKISMSLVESPFSTSAKYRGKAPDSDSTTLWRRCFSLTP